jgi:hypothetical protein
MSLKKIHIFIDIIFFFLILLYPLNLQAEFYKYVDKEGRTFYVDDLSRVPPEYLDQVNVYKEKYDHLPEGERKSRLEQEQQRNSSSWKKWSLKGGARWSWNCNRPLKKKKPQEN